ncbi:hypothetical protein [Romboutsia ilealis]|uniref:hypothetical protein n=1 Tax=Romboutsia ilealis TaxID=1115758 RepID=UPI0026F404D2|nr:hypothetical protein [Romboutsia ilealis]
MTVLQVTQQKIFYRDELYKVDNVTKINDHLYLVDGLKLKINRNTLAIIKHYCTGDLYKLMLFIETQSRIPSNFICRECGIDPKEYRMWTVNKHELQEHEIQALFNWVYNQFKGEFVRIGKQIDNQEYMQYHKCNYEKKNKDMIALDKRLRTV